MSLKDKLDKVCLRHQELRELLETPSFAATSEYPKASKEYSDLEPLVEAIDTLRRAEQELKDAQDMAKDPNMDPELKAMAEADIQELGPKIEELDHQVKVLLLPKDEADERNAILEVRAGAGGDEAGLFASELLRMYQRYCELKGWKMETMSLSESGIGSLREASISITGKGVFARLKYESGTHRVQRVPVTESGGRIHTSTATVAVLPEAEEVDVHIEEKDLRIDVFRSSGPGGQSVNTTDSAVRITHLPTGIVVQQQDEKSQHKNKAKALKVLRARIYDAQRAAVDQERASQRKNQVGTGDRSERIRTYNFPQGRVSDHRINLTLYKLQQVLDGQSLDEFVDALTSEDQASRLSDIGE